MRKQQTTPHAKWSCAEYWVETVDRCIITYYYGGRGEKRSSLKKIF